MVEALLAAEGLTYGYPQHGLGLAPLDLAVAEGELWAVSGRSGCGKSTLARCLTGIIPHLYHGEMGGRVRVAGLDTREAPLWRLAEIVGLLFQNPRAQSVASSAQDEVLFGLGHLDLPVSAQRERCRAYLERFGLTELADRRPDTLSGGELQRLMLAAVLAREPRALVLDEPLSMLDSTAAGELVVYLSELARQGTAVVACEHRHDYLDPLPGLRHLRLGDGADAPAVEPSPPPLPGAAESLHLRNVRLGHGPRTLFDSLSLDLEAGQVIALVGRNGVGKTTLLRAMARLMPYEGHIVARESGGVEVAPLLGLMFQNPDWQLFNPSVREEILYRVPSPDGALYAWLLDALALRPYENLPPLLLSEGEKKRLALATLLMRRPRHGLLLDEPTLGQDDAHRRMLGGVVRGLAGAGHVVVAATHDLAWVAHYADRIVLLAPGGVAAQGETAVVLGDTGAWREAGLALPSWLGAPTVPEVPVCR